jgi:outer membrane protein OmpA-like peptidoglycan-associated protein
MGHSIHASATPDAARDTGAARRTRRVDLSPDTIRHGGLADARAVLSESGRPLDRARRRDHEARLHHDFAAVRIHDDDRASRSARAMDARAYTVGTHIVLDRDRCEPSSPDGDRLLAHELAHVVQQGVVADMASVRSIGSADSAAEREASAMSALPSTERHVREQVAPQIQRDLVAPGRLAEVHQDLFVSAPGPGGGTRRTWRDPTSTDAGTAGEIIRQAKAAIRQFVADNPMAVGGSIDTRTTQANLDADALIVNQRIRRRFPQITLSVSDQQIADAVGVITSSITSDADFLHEWLANRLITWSDIELYSISETDPRFIAVLDALLADSDVGPDIRVMASRIGGFQRGEGTSREIFVHRGASQAQRRLILIHELVHFYAHASYRDWVNGTTDSRFYNEGFTEWLAQRVMTSEERADRSSYHDRVNAIQTQVAARVSEDDMARAFFGGEVWRIETKSTIARREFASASGIREGATQREEAADSRTGPGINEEVAAGAHYRFLNLGHDRAEPKPEHVTYFDTIKSTYIDHDTALRVRFEGHASTAGSEGHNDRLSLLRAQAFYRMARTQGVPAARLIGASRPAHFGETRPTLTEEDAQTRAFNRRVEMLLTPGDAPAGAARSTDDESRRSTAP